jgi:AraC-like DNA-binding protein/mannose-6-phosphate isomerase-like protein (cupin superfamily)
MSMEARIDYGQPGVWEQLAARFEHHWEARPTPAYGHVVCDPGWSWQPRLHDYDLWFAVRGCGTVALGEQVFPIQPGTLLFMRPGDRGWATQDLVDRLTVIFIHLNFHVPGDDTLATVAPEWLPSRYIPFPQAAPINLTLGRVVKLLDRRQRLEQVEAKWVLQQALLDVYRQDAVNQGFTTARLDPRLERVMAHVRGHPEARHTLHDAAAMAELSPTYFSQVFKREFGTSFRAYVVQARLERAHYLLSETTLPVGQIADTLGYRDVFLFSRQFKQQYGVSPNTLRRP